MPTRRHIARGILDALGGLPLFVTAPLYRRRHLRWGATDDEVVGAMPGDDLVERASFNASRAITINAPAEAVWPWIVQLGYRRAGFYTYDLLDNAGHESTSEVLEEFQHPRVGDWMPMTSTVSETTAFRVAAFETGQWLLWAKPDSTWAWKLVRLAGGRTRLITRLRQHYRWRTPAMALFTLLLLEFGDFPMMRRLLQGIKVRAESLGAAKTLPDTDLTKEAPVHDL